MLLRLAAHGAAEAARKVLSACLSDGRCVGVMGGGGGGGPHGGDDDQMEESVSWAKFGERSLKDFKWQLIQVRRWWS